MIIQCEKCGTKFKLDESHIKEEGSKVRCSLCKHIFLVHPPEQIYGEEGETIAFSREDIEASVAKDLPGGKPEKESQAEPDDQEIEFDNVFEDSLEALKGQGGESSETPLDQSVEEAAFAEKALEFDTQREEIRPAAAEEKHDEEIREDPGSATVAPARKRGGKSHLLPILLVIILVLIGGAAAIFLWVPELIPDSLSMLKPAEKQELTDMGVRRLSFKAVTGSFVDSEMSGNLFVIQGMVSNDYPKPRSFVLIKGSILDDKGQIVTRKLAYAGNSLDAGEIKSMPLEEINKAMKNRYGRDKKNVNVPPGALTPFTIVFENLPKNLSEFTVEAVSSSPGT
jgi:predicted Zn finger-like uncharacterized protein